MVDKLLIRQRWHGTLVTSWNTPDRSMRHIPFTAPAAIRRGRGGRRSNIFQVSDNRVPSAKLRVSWADFSLLPIGRLWVVRDIKTLAFRISRKKLLAPSDRSIESKVLLSTASRTDSREGKLKLRSVSDEGEYARIQP